MPDCSRRVYVRREEIKCIPKPCARTKPTGIQIRRVAARPCHRTTTDVRSRDKSMRDTYLHYWTYLPGPRNPRVRRLSGGARRWSVSGRSGRHTLLQRTCFSLRGGRHPPGDGGPGNPYVRLILASLHGWITARGKNRHGIRPGLHPGELSREIKALRDRSSELQEALLRITASLDRAPSCAQL